MAKGPVGNAPRDLHDSFVGENVLYTGGEPPKKTRKPKYVTSNTFHSKVTGETSNKRADRPGHFRSGGFVRGKDGADAGDMKAGFPKGPPNKKLLQDADDMEPVVRGSVKKKFADGGILDDSRMVPMPQIGEAKGLKAVPMPQVGTPEGMKMAPMPYVQQRGPNISRTDAERERIWGLNRKKGGKV